MGSAWTFALARLAAALALAIAGGLIFGRIDLWLVVVLGGYLALQLSNLYRLQRWLRHRREEDPPDLGGVWGDVVALVGRIYRRKNVHKRRVSQLFREFRRLTAAMPEGVEDGIVNGMYLLRGDADASVQLLGSGAILREVIAAALRRELGLDFLPEDIAMTQGAFGAIAVAFSMLLDPGDECIVPIPGWFCYTTILRACNAIPVKAPLLEDSFDLDVAAIERAITPRTRIVVVNTPHNPTGIVYSRERLKELAAMLERKSAEIGRPIFILSDEPYRRIRFDGAPFTSPAEVYPWTLIDYSYGKVLLAPGLRLGYLAICPDMPEVAKDLLLASAMSTQVALGWGFPRRPPAICGCGS